MFTPRELALARGWPGRIEGDRVIQLAAQTLPSFFTGGASARDLQRNEMRVGLGPAKGKDFATSLGPVLVTPDEFDGTTGTMIARVNGEERSRGNLSAMYHSWNAVLEQAARNTHLRPGDIIGSGTVGTGCILEHGDERWLQRGDEVELEIEGIGILRNTVT